MIRIVISMLLLGLISLLPALRVEPPQDLMHFDNLEFDGIGSIRQDGTSILAWRKTIDEIKCIQIMRFSDAGTPMWPEPVTLADNGGYYLESGSDAFFVVMVSFANLRVFKYSLSGAAIWPSAGINLEPSNSLMPYEVSIFPDTTGGLWLVSNSQSYAMPRHYAAVQRLDTNGNVVFGSGDIIYGGDDCYYRDGIMLPDNSIMISLSFRNANTLVRIGQDGSELYRGDFPNTQPALEYSSLAALSGTKVAYAVGRKDFADVYVFNVFGAATTLQNSFSITYEAGAAYYVTVDALSETEAVVGAMNYAKSALVMTRISETGDVFYQRTINNHSYNYGLRYALHSAGNGECYIIYNSDEHILNSGIKFEQIGSDGSTLWHGYLHSYENYSGERPDFLSACLSGDFKVYWMDYRLDASGIYYVAFYTSGSIAFPDEPLVTGSRGFIMDSKVLPRGQSAIVATLHKKDNMTTAILHLDMIDPTPDSSWPAEGIDVVTGEYVSEMKTLKAGEDILVLWLQGFPGYAYADLKAQLVSAEGQLLWGPEGIDVYSGSIRSFFGTIIDGSIFIAWQTHVGDIYCQKVLGGLLLGPGILIEEQEGQVLADFIHGYVIMHVYGGIRVLKISSDGSMIPAFGDEGLLVSTSGYSSYFSSRSQEDHLILALADSGSYPSQINTYVISPDASILPVVQHLANGVYIRSYLSSGFLYTARYDNGLEISKTNLAGPCLWTRQLPVYVPYDGFINGAIEALTDSSFALLYCAGSTSNAMHYYVFDADGNSTMANPELLYSSPMSMSRHHAIAEDGIYLLYRDYDKRQWLKLQKIDLESQEQSDEDLPPTPQIVFKNPYPNPFKDFTTIRFYLKDASFARVSLYNLKGQRVKELYAGNLPSGLGSIDWDGRDSKGQSCAQGIYFVRMEALGKVINAKLIKLK